MGWEVRRCGVFGVERFQPTVAIFATRFGARGEEVGSGGCVATRVRASLQESMVERLRGGSRGAWGKRVSSIMRAGHHHSQRVKCRTDGRMPSTKD